MAEMDIDCMMATLEDLTQEEFNKSRTLFHKKGIPFRVLEKADRIEMATILNKHCSPDHMKVLFDVLNSIPRKDLVEKLWKKQRAEKEKECSSQDVQTDGVEPPRLSEPESYCGTYRLSDLEYYATNNQDQLIKQLEDQLEPNAMEELKKQLAQRKLKHSFLFTAKESYELFSNQDVERYLKDTFSGKKSQKIPKKIIDILFFLVKSNKKIKAVGQKWSKDHTNFKRKLQESELTDKPTTSNPANSTGEHEPKYQRKELPANEEKENALIPQNVSFLKQNYREESEAEIEYERKDKDVFLRTSENKDLAFEDSQGSESEVPQLKTENELFNDIIRKQQSFIAQNEIEPEIEYERNDKDFFLRTSENKELAFEDSQGSESEVPQLKTENELFNDAIRKWHEMKVGKSSFDHIGVREHKTCSCFIAQNVLLFRLAGNTEYRLLRILQNKKDLTPKKKLKKNVEFELQFNMAILDAPSSDVIDCMSDFSDVIQSDSSSFAKFENFFKDVVSKIVLPLLALYKRVQVNIPQKALECY
ncbi:uncharacterized protein LOC128329013 [Hemicordylus capensis]|uniref:uncharacterized protein LOC128329013 n=1 Tax=Hemicordylus capensis TaxID=884348 RepID=UPI002304CD3A|nr:uncharacterized protein LOC128329013 [Hemicordylus capensis]